MPQHTQHSLNGSSKITHWRCPNCGQCLFTTPYIALPKRCGMCHQTITWEELGNHPRRWRCPNCGQTLFTAPDDKPPDMCDYCQDFTTWARIFD
ncbi:MAG: hypothetical protein WBC91_26555 [Phototrophicaceae bacterium]